MYAGVTWLSRALKRPSKSVNYVEAVSSTTFNLAPPLPECTHVEDKLSKAGIVHKPFAGGIDYPHHLLVVPLGYFVRDEQGFVVAEKLGDTITGHSAESLHYELLNGIGNGFVSEDNWPDDFFGVAVGVFERKG